MAKAMAFGGVEMGSMKAKEHASVTHIMCATGDTWNTGVRSVCTQCRIHVARTRARARSLSCARSLCAEAGGW